MAKDKERLQNFIHSEIKAIQKQVLSLSEMLVPNEKWNSYRSRILDITNDVRRRMQAELENNYEVDYSPKTVCEDVIEVHSAKVQGVNYRQRGKGHGTGKNTDPDPESN